MPTLLIIFGFRFYFFLNEHKPIHVHVKAGNGKAKVELEPEVRLVYSKGLKEQELSKIMGVCRIYQEDFIIAWKNRFNDYGED